MIKKFIRHPVTVKTVAFVGSLITWAIMHLLFFTCRQHIFGPENLDALLAENNRKILSPNWHRSIFFSVYIHRNQKGAILSSRSRDGEMISAVLHRFGYYTARGSSGRKKGGHLGLKAFVDYVNKGNPGGITVDAPLGPPHISKRGIILAAAKTGAPLLPQIWYARPNFRFRSWDGTMLPKPFSEIVMIIDDQPIHVPTGATKATIEQYRKVLEERMLHLTYQVDHWFDMRDTYPDPRDIPVPSPVPTPSLVS
jgi:lysophospholipid acyltransferase (LPLAT)-like uncharacterized protein